MARPYVWLVKHGSFSGIASIKENGYATLEHVVPSTGKNKREFIALFLLSLKNKKYKGIIIQSDDPFEQYLLNEFGFHNRIILNILTLNVNNDPNKFEKCPSIYTIEKSELSSIEMLQKQSIPILAHNNKEYENWLNVNPSGFLGFVDDHNKLIGAGFCHEGNNQAGWIRGLIVREDERSKMVGKHIVNSLIFSAQNFKAHKISIATIHVQFWLNLDFTKSNKVYLYYKENNS